LPPDKLRNDVPPLLGKIISDCLQFSPARRPSSATSVGSALQEFGQQQFAASFEVRIRRFLMESKLLAGNPSLIEVEEKTFPPPAQGLFSRLKDGPARNLSLLFLLVGLLAGGGAAWGYLQYLRPATTVGSPDFIESPPVASVPVAESSVPVPAPSVDAKPKAKPAPRRPQR